MAAVNVYNSTIDGNFPDIARRLGEAAKGYQHSFYLYAQTPEFQQAMQFVRNPATLNFSKPFAGK